MPSVVSAPKQQMAHGNDLVKIYEFNLLDSCLIDI